MKKNLKVYDVNVDESEIFIISLVSEPAVGIDFIKFNKDESPMRWKFSKENERMVVSGVAMLADTPIYRYSKDMGEYYIRFGKEELKKLVVKYLKTADLTMFNIEHTDNLMKDITLLESYFIDTKRGVVPNDYKDIPDGSWIVSLQVTNEEVWEKLKETNLLNGFSIECLTSLTEKKEDELDKYLKEIMK